MVWEVAGFDLGSAEFADRPLCAGSWVHEGVYILVYGGASSVSQLLRAYPKSEIDDVVFCSF